MTKTKPNIMGRQPREGDVSNLCNYYPISFALCVSSRCARPRPEIVAVVPIGKRKIGSVHPIQKTTDKTIDWGWEGGEMKNDDKREVTKLIENRATRRVKRSAKRRKNNIIYVHIYTCSSKTREPKLCQRKYKQRKNGMRKSSCQQSIQKKY
mgnify:CR=1 FL=1